MMNIETICLHTDATSPPKLESLFWSGMLLVICPGRAQVTFTAWPKKSPFQNGQITGLHQANNTTVTGLRNIQCIIETRKDGAEEIYPGEIEKNPE